MHPFQSSIAGKKFHRHQGAIPFTQTCSHAQLSNCRSTQTSLFNSWVPQDTGQTHMVSLEKSLRSCPLDQTMVSRDTDALPFKRKRKHPNSHADNMSDKWVHPSTPLPHLVLSSLEETQENNCLCLSGATTG